APHRRGARRSSNALGSARYRRGDARGLEVSPGSLLQNELVQRQVRDRPAQTGILLLELLQALHLVGLEPAVLLPPPIIGDLAHADLADRVSDVLALRDQHINLPQLRNDLFRRVSLLRHCSPPSCQKTYFRSDHFSGGGPIQERLEPSSKLVFPIRRCAYHGRPSKSRPPMNH